jgi:hypothetical protein
MQRKLSDAQIAEIKRRLLARSVFWQSQRSIAKEFGVSHCLIPLNGPIRADFELRRA